MRTIPESLNGMQDLMPELHGSRFEVELAKAAATLEYAPYLFPDEKAPSRLTRAIELVRLSRVQLHDAHRATVYGSTRSYALDGYACTCDAALKGRTHWCVHAVSVKLARQLATRGLAAPEADAARRERLPAAGHGQTTLDLPPTTADERLARTPGETLQDAPDAQEIPEMDQDSPPAPATTQEAPRAMESTMPVQVHTALLEPTARAPVSLEQSLQDWSAQRAVVRRFIKQELVEGIDYYTLTFKGRVTKPTLSKAGSEKFLGLFQLRALFAPDMAMWEMLGKPADVLCCVCTLLTRSGEAVSEGRGARKLAQDGGDINKAIKMVEKSSQVAAVLRTGALSDVFTQDFEPDEEAPGPAPTPAQRPPTRDHCRQHIWAWIKVHHPAARTPAETAAAIKSATGLDLLEHNFVAIAERLEMLSAMEEATP